MGSWNETCGITQLPICFGDNIRAFILNRSSSHRNGGGGYCYSDDAWSPYGFSIVGKYDDYGSIEDIKEDYCSKLLLNKIISQIDFSNYDAEENSYHVDLKDNNLGWNEIVTAISQEEIPLKDASLGIMFVLEDVYQCMIKLNKVNTTRDKGGYLYKKLDQVIDDEIPVFFKKIQDIARLKAESAAQISSLEKEDPNNLKLDLQIKLDILSDLLDDHNYDSLVSSMFSGHKNHGLRLYKNELSRLAGEGKGLEDNNIKQIFAAFKEHVCFSFAMSDLRKGWLPQFGKGSQDNNTEAHVILAETIINISKKLDAKWESEVGARYSEYELSDWHIKHNEEELKRRKLLAFT